MQLSVVLWLALLKLVLTKGKLNFQEDRNRFFKDTIIDLTASPTVEPTESPFVTILPSESPSNIPSLRPSSFEPSVIPSSSVPSAPTLRPTTSLIPTRGPTYPPTFKPTVSPSIKPTFSPTAAATEKPTKTSQPSTEPSLSPTLVPTTPGPTNIPVFVRTQFPTVVSRSPSVVPSLLPTVTVTVVPTPLPSVLPSRIPSIRPTRVPTTAQPTLKTESPTYSTAAPVIESIDAVLSSSSVVLRVTFTEPTVYTGVLYCTALSPSFVLSSPSQVVSIGLGEPYAVNTSTLSMQMDGFSALVTYDVYCSVKNIWGSENSLSQVLATKTSVTFACCKSITFSNAPQFVFGDTSYYSAAQTSSFVFTYSLSALPSASIGVTPLLVSQTTGTAVSSMQVRISPKSLNFTSSSTSLSGSFVLKASSAYQDSLTLVLIVTGASRTEYSAVNRSVSILSLGSYVPAPTLSYAQFTDSGANMLIAFSAATDKAGMSSSDDSFPCQVLFSFQAVDQGTSCSWLNSTMVKVDFGTYSEAIPYITVGQSVSLLGGVVKAQCVSLNYTACNLINKFAVNQSVPLLQPVNVVIPDIVLLVPEVISSCDNLTVNAAMTTGSGGRLFSSRLWTVSGVGVSDDNITAIVNYLNTFSIKRISQQSLVLPSTLFEAAVYSLSLTLVNFFGISSTTTVHFEISNNLNIPSLSIVGSNSWNTLSSEELTVYASAALSSCANSVQMTYSWRLLLDGAVVTSVSSISVDPTAYMLVPYSLLSNRVYTLSVTATVPVTGSRASAVATASRSISVQSGAVQAAIKGGSVLQILRTSVQVLDASISSDQNLLDSGGSASSSSSELSFGWSCSIVSALNYGDNCNYLLNDREQNSSAITVVGAVLSSAKSYSFSVLVTAQDGRHATTSVSVTVDDTSLTLSANQTAVTYISSKVVKFNPDSQLSLFGFVTSLSEVDASWVALVDGVAQNVSTLTSISKHFTVSVVSKTISFPLVIPASTFASGTLLTFRLQLSQSSSDLSNGFLAYSEMSVQVNAPPSGGVLSVSPSSGEALSTSFDIFTASWIDDPSDYPLTYSFTYSAVSSEDSNQLYLKNRNTIASVSSMLPAGDSFDGYSLFIIVKAYDSYLAYSAEVQQIVVSQATVDVSAYLLEQLNLAFSSSNINLATNAINSAGSSISVSNCTTAGVAFCTALNREVCTGSNTCGSCLDGYVGISGSSNAKCHSSDIGAIGESCELDADCLYGNCTNAVCVEPVQVCPSVYAESVCSGHGSCGYYDIAGNLLDYSCGLFNQFCSAACICVDGFGGSDCSLDSAALASHDVTRFQLCEGIVKVSNTSNPSLLLLEQLINSLAISFSPSEVVSQATYVECITALSSIAELAESGYLVGSNSDISKNLILLASKFVSGSVVNSQYSANTSFASAVTQILIGLEKSVAAGQNSVAISSDNIRISIRRDLSSDLILSDLQAPASVSEAAYGQYKSSSISLSPVVAAMCDSGTGYAKMTMMQWNNNPYNEKSLGSPVLRTDSKTCRTSSSSSSSRRLQQQQQGQSMHASSERRLADSWTNDSRTERNADNSTLVGLFYISLQFTAPQNFDFSIDPDSVVYEGDNTTFPECKVYDGEKFVSCDNGCHISHYTNYNVTYACFDGSVLCGSCDDDSNEGSSSVRVLGGEPGSDDVWDHEDVLIERFYEATGNKVSAYAMQSMMTTQRPSHSSSSSSYHRMLQSLSGDDDGSTTGGKVTSGQFAAIMGSIKTEIAVVLSFNPLNIDLDKAKPILIFVSALFFVIMGGFVYFTRWDRWDHNMMVYSNKMNVQQALLMKKAALDQAGSHFDDHKYQELRKFFEDKREQLRNRKRWLINKKAKSFIATRKCAVTGELLEDNNSSDKRGADADAKARDENIGDENTERDFLIAAKEVGYDSILDIPSVNQEFVVTHDKFIVNTVSAFLGYVIPIASTELNNEKFYHHIIQKHDYSSSFSDPSLFMNRTNRWLNVCMQLMLALFLDTIFFGMFFPDSGTCQALHSQHDCTSIMNKATNLPMCSWSEDDSAAHTYECTLNFPPNTVTFIVLVALLTILFAVPVSFLYDYLRIKICTRRPDFKHCCSWFDHFLQSSTKNAVNEDNQHSTLHDLYDDINRKRAQDADYQMHLMSHSSEEYQQRALDEVNTLARKVYDGVTSSAEEVDQILNEVQQFLNEFVLTSKTPWNNTFSSEAVRSKAAAIQRYIGVYPDGTPVPLSLFDLMYYGTAREKLRQKLLKSRLTAKRIASHLNKMGDIEANNKDMSLIQFFILEQFDPVKRYALRYQFFNFPVSTPNTIDPFTWVLTWCFLLGSLLFYLYWVLAWGIQSGGHTFKAWGLNFILSFAEDVCLIQLVKIYVLYVLAMFSIRPQLGYIYATLNKVAIKYAQEGPTEDDSIRVVQHLSAACRAARSGVCKDLAAAKILSQIDDSDMRACRKNGRTPLPAVAFLVVLIPALLTLLFNDSFGEMVMSAILPSLFTIFIMLNYYIYTASVVFLAIVWAIVAAFLYWRFYRHRRSSRRKKLARDLEVSVEVVEQKNLLEMQKHSHLNRLSHRTAVSASLRKYLLCVQENLMDLCYLVVWIAFLPISQCRKWRGNVSDHRGSDRTWMRMNYPEELQGQAHFTVREETREPPINDVPFYVLNVMASEWRSEEWTDRKRGDYLTALLNTHLLNVQQIDLTEVKDQRHVPRSTRMLTRKQSMNPKSNLRRTKSNMNKSALSLSHSHSRSYSNDDDDRKSVNSDLVPSVFTLDTLHSAAQKVSNLRKPRHFKPSATKVKTVRTDPSWESQQGRNFRYRFTTTTDEYTALRRMLLKHLGPRQFASAKHDHRYNDNNNNKGLPELVAEYDDFNELIKVTVLSAIMNDIFTIYHPAGVMLDAEELSGVLEDYTHWSENSKNIDDCGLVPFVVFQEWFVAMNLRLIKYRAVIEGFEVDNIDQEVDFLHSSSVASIEQEHKQEELAVHISVNVFSAVIAEESTQLCSNLLTDRENALSEAHAEKITNDVVREMCSAVVKTEISSMRDLVTDIGVDLVTEDEGVQNVVLQLEQQQSLDYVEASAMLSVSDELVGELLLDVSVETYTEQRIEELEQSLMWGVLHEFVAEHSFEVSNGVYSQLSEDFVSHAAALLVSDVCREVSKGVAIQVKLDFSALLQELALKVLNEVVLEEVLLLSKDFQSDKQKQRESRLMDELQESIACDVLSDVLQSEVPVLVSKVRREILNIVELLLRGEVVSEVVEAEARLLCEEQQHHKHQQLLQCALSVSELLLDELLTADILATAEEVRLDADSESSDSSSSTSSSSGDEHKHHDSSAAAPVVAVVTPRSKAAPGYLVKTQSFLIKEKPKMLTRTKSTKDL